MDKEIKSKPVYYAIILPELQKIAVKHGYNLVPHGSFNRDFDLICIAWNDDQWYLDISFTPIGKEKP